MNYPATPFITRDGFEIRDATLDETGRFHVEPEYWRGKIDEQETAKLRS